MPRPLEGIQRANAEAFLEICRRETIEKGGRPAVFCYLDGEDCFKTVSLFDDPADLRAALIDYAVAARTFSDRDSVQVIDGEIQP